MLAYIPRAAFRKPRSGCLSNIFRNDGPDCQYLQCANYRVSTQASRLKVACLPSMWITSVWPVIRKQCGDLAVIYCQKSITRKLGNSGAQSSSNSWEIVGRRLAVDSNCYQ